MGEIERLIAPGAHDFLAKPIDVGRLNALLDDTLLLPAETV